MDKVNVRLIRDKLTGDYYTEDGRFHLEKGSVGWIVYKDGNFFPCGYPDTLRAFRESLSSGDYDSE